MANVVPSPVLDTRGGDQVAAEAINALPSELSDRSDANPAVAIIEACTAIYDKALYQINRWPRALVQQIMAWAGITLRSASPAICTQQFTLSAPQRTDTVIEADTEVATVDGEITFKTLSDLTIAAFTTPAGTVAVNAGSAELFGSGTTFVTGSTWVGWQIQVPANTGRWYTIATVNTTTSITISGTFDVTVTGQAWNVGPVSGTTTAQSTTTGAETNVGAGKLTTLSSAPAGVASTTNTTAATGGADEETAAEAIARGPSEYGARDVAVCNEDYETFAVKILGANGRAKARGGYNGTTATDGYVTVAMLAPAWTTSSSVTTADRAAVLRDLASRSQSGVTVVDRAATITALTASGSTPAAVVYRKSAYDASSTRIAIAQAINTFYSPNTYEWGRNRYVADMVQVVESVSQVDRVHVINGVPAVGTDYRTAGANMTVTNASATVTADAADVANMTQGQTFLIDSANNGAYLVTGISGTTLTISPTWAGSSGATANVPFFRARDVDATDIYTLFYANLGTTTSTLPASIIVTGAV